MKKMQCTFLKQIVVSNLARYGWRTWCGSGHIRIFWAPPYWWSTSPAPKRLGHKTRLPGGTHADEWFITDHSHLIVGHAPSLLVRRHSASVVEVSHGCSRHQAVVERVSSMLQFQPFQPLEGTFQGFDVVHGVSNYVGLVSLRAT
jgi:hypothetical protein